VQGRGGEGGGDYGCFGEEHDLLKDLAYFPFSVLLLDSSVEQCACLVFVSARSTGDNMIAALNHSIWLVFGVLRQSTVNERSSD